MSSVAAKSPDTPPPCFAAPRVRSNWFQQEVLLHESQLRAYLRGSFPKVRDVDDIVQESYLRIWRRHAVRPIESAKAFLFAVARRLAIDGIRHENVCAIDAVEDLAALAVYDNGSSAADAASRAEIIRMLIAAIDALPVRCREVVILRKFQLLSAREAARQLGVKEQTVEVQLARGNHRIREYLAARGITTVLGREP